MDELFFADNGLIGSEFVTGKVGYIVNREMAGVLAIIVAEMVVGDAKYPGGERRCTAIFKRVDGFHDFYKNVGYQIFYLPVMSEAIGDVSINAREVVAIEFTEGVGAVAGVFDKLLFLFRRQRFVQNWVSQ